MGWGLQTPRSLPHPWKAIRTIAEAFLKMKMKIDWLINYNTGLGGGIGKALASLAGFQLWSSDTIDL